MLQYESRLLEKFQGNPGYCQMLWSGVEGEFNVLVMDLCGPTIEELFNFCECKFSIKTVLWIASELVARIQTMHE